MDKFVIRLIACGIALATCTLCYAEDSGPQAAGNKQLDQKSIIQLTDANDDGVISHDEFVTARDKCFKAMDKNCDGYLCNCEFNDGAEQGFARLDANKDGSIDSDEATALFTQSNQ